MEREGCGGMEKQEPECCGRLEICGWGLGEERGGELEAEDISPSRSRFLNRGSLPVLARRMRESARAAAGVLWTARDLRVGICLPAGRDWSSSAIADYGPGLWSGPIYKALGEVSDEILLVRIEPGTGDFEFRG